MRAKCITRLLVGAGLLAAAQGATAGQIVGSAHDFSSKGWGSSEICIFCHAPHNNANVAGDVLWNHALSTATYTLYSSPSMNATVTQPGGVSKLCLSCHDGTVAIDSYGARTGTNFVTGGKNLGTNFSNDHPIGITYDAALVTADGTLKATTTAVTIGTGAQTPVVLYFIGEGRYRASSFQEVALDTAQLTWDYATSTSNYESLRQWALAQNPRAYLTTFAQPQFFSNTVFPTEDGGTRSFLALFADQARQNGDAPGGCAVSVPSYDGSVVNPCPPGAPYDSPECGEVAPGEIDARLLGCDGAYDLSVALDGMRFGDVWVTRIEGIWPREALTEDLEVGATIQTPVRNALEAQQTLNEDKACEGFGGVLPWKKLDEPPRSRLAPWMLLFASLLWVSRRAARHRWVRSRWTAASV